ncbi:hypothetical protein Rsub_04589 [Raphidocelis subcapitata]|uniref:SAP domain-containing protein n=1 Tax=Raphidocelis subcapitata TaxID=307507 RepID=A0A2V0P5Y0_9CHLO|nr:hypothetical protein Rsub_04589 [Raphidocelis subcapitata]|eukprot:GBF92485.1 hypothetical protein Rsub_04589 [Raphidocelis subcapitata]
MGPGACLLGGAPRKLLLIRGGEPAGPTPRKVVTEAVSLDQWYKRSLRFRSVHAAAAGQRQRRPAPVSAAPASTDGGAAGGGSWGAAKRPAPWPAEDARGAADQRQGPKRPHPGTAGSSEQQQPRQQQRPSADRAPASTAAAGPASKPAGPQQQQQQQRAATAVCAPLAAPGPGPAPARQQLFTPEQLQSKTAKEVSELLRARGQSGAGRKEQLVVRLLDFQRRMRRAMQPAGAR